MMLLARSLIIWWGDYDPDRDPFADVNEAVTIAKSEGKNILLIVGGDWCVWCDILEGYLYDQTAVSQAL